MKRCFTRASIHADTSFVRKRFIFNFAAENEGTYWNGYSTMRHNDINVRGKTFGFVARSKFDMLLIYFRLSQFAHFCAISIDSNVVIYKN